MKELIHTSWLALTFLLLFGMAEVLYHFLKVKAEYTRKFVHFGTGVLTLLFPIYLNNPWLVLFLCGSFAIILLVSLKYKLLPSINAIERKSYGSLCYPLAVFFCYLFYDWYQMNPQATGGYLIFYLPILILAISDPLAALVGRKFPYGVYKVGCGYKTIMGSTVFFLSAFAISLVFISGFSAIEPFNLRAVFMAIGISLITTFAESISKNGMDNLYIPLSGTVITYLMLTFLH